MHPIIIRLGPLAVYSYGVMVALGFVAALFLILRRAPRFGIDQDRMIDLVVILLASGIVGGRALYVALNWGHYAANPLEMLNLSRGGLVWYGAFLSALAALIIYSKKKGLDAWNVADLIAPYLALAQSLGRIGCFLNGCCYGVARHPTQVYSSLALLAIFAVLRIWQERRRFGGEIFLGYLLLYSAKRFFIEFLRGDNPKILAGLTFSQLISAVVFPLALVYFLKKASKWRRENLNSR